MATPVYLISKGSNYYGDANGDYFYDFEEASDFAEFKSPGETHNVVKATLLPGESAIVMGKTVKINPYK